MTYGEYLRFYNLEPTAETRESWLLSLWAKGIVYRKDGKFYSTTTGKEIN